MFPDRSFEIKYHKKNAETFLSEKNYDMARLSFFKYFESVRQQNINTNGKLEEDLEKAEEEYSNFVRIDPLYNNILTTVIPIIKTNPDILQTDLYKLVTNYKKEDITYCLFFAEKHGKVKRIKKGRTYILSINQ